MKYGEMQPWCNSVPSVASFSASIARPSFAVMIPMVTLLANLLRCGCLQVPTRVSPFAEIVVTQAISSVVAMDFACEERYWIARLTVTRITQARGTSVGFAEQKSAKTTVEVPVRHTFAIKPRILNKSVGINIFSVDSSGRTCTASSTSLRRACTSSS